MKRSETSGVLTDKTMSKKEIRFYKTVVRMLQLYAVQNVERKTERNTTSMRLRQMSVKALRKNDGE